MDDNVKRIDTGLLCSESPLTLLELETPLTLTPEAVLRDTHLPDATPDTFREPDPTVPKSDHPARRR